ncbi:hypothetical protein FAGKG844_270011 [Frankia sp. AgKG'84/4]
MSASKARSPSTAMSVPLPRHDRLADVPARRAHVVVTPPQATPTRPNLEPRFSWVKRSTYRTNVPPAADSMVRPAPTRCRGPPDGGSVSSEVSCPRR